MKSNVLSLYTSWVETASPEDLKKADDFYFICEQNYEAGGDAIVECYSPEDLLREFKTIMDLRIAVERHNEQGTNCRWGEDTDPEVNKPTWKE